MAEFADLTAASGSMIHYDQDILEALLRECVQNSDMPVEARALALLARAIRYGEDCERQDPTERFCLQKNSGNSSVRFGRPIRALLLSLLPVLAGVALLRLSRRSRTEASRGV